MPSHIAFDWQNSPSQGMAVRSESSDSLRTNAVPAVLAFDTPQVCSKENRSNPQPGDPCHPLAATAHPPLIVPTVLAFDYKQDGGNNGDGVSPTLLATPHDKSHANGGGHLAVVAFRDNMGGNDGGIHEDGTTAAVTPVHVPAVCVTGERTHALTSEGADASEDGTGRGTPVVVGTLSPGAHPGGANGQDAYSGHVIPTAGIPRRLTPRECERLQGWPDDYTRYGVDENGRRYELSDSARYRICGNGIGAPHTHWIGLRYLAAWQRLTTSHQERAA